MPNRRPGTSYKKKRERFKAMFQMGRKEFADRKEAVGIKRFSATKHKELVGKI